jgi:peptidyl-prolyl cis-trans isomerase D
MAIIGKIQEKGRYLLVGFVGLALLTFIFSGLQKCDSMGGPIPIGVIAGEDVDAMKYQAQLERMEIQDRNQYAQQQREYTDRDADQTADRAWAATVDEILLGKEYEALGIEVSDHELDSYLYGEDGFQLLPDIAQNFADSVTGKFNPAALQRFIEERENSKGEDLKQWNDTKEALRKQRQQEKYFQLLGQAVYVTKLEAKEEYTAKNEIKSIDFVLRSFRDLKDEDIRITDAEIRKFYDEHKGEKKYEVLAGRDVKYFDITIQPSRKDSAEFNKVLTKLKKEFTATTEDSMFVIRNTESTQRFGKTANPYRAQGDPNAKGLIYPAYMDTIFKSASTGQVVGPYSDQGKTYLAKVLGFNTQSLSARHILLPAQKTDAAASAKQKKVADSLATLLNTDKTRFEEFVKTYSSDQGSSQNGGKYEDFSKDEFVPEFSDFVIANPVGKIGVVQTDYGYHIIEVLGKKDARIPLLAVVEKTLLPSQDTEMELNDKAHDLLFKFEKKISSLSDPLARINMFDTLAKKEGYFARPVRMLDESPKVTGFNTKLAEQKIIALAYGDEPEVGTMCSSPISDKGRYIIAMVSSIRKEKGEPSFEDAYLTMRAEAIKEKKANKFLAQIGSTRNLEQLAKKGNTTVNSAEITFANPSIQGGGYEPEVIGSLFSGLKDGQTTKPLVGNTGVYVVRINKTKKAPAAQNYDSDRMQMIAQARGGLQSSIRSALQKKAEVYDNRELSRLNIRRD